MIRRATHLLGITSRYPFGYQESYIETELEELKQYFGNVTLVPVRSPEGPRRTVPEKVAALDWPLCNVEVLARAIAAVLTRPSQCASAVATLLASRDPGKAKNLAVMLKGLALGQWACEHGVTHVHAYWMSTPASVAFIAASVAEVQWSATAHRWDIYEKNAFDVKSGATFVRTISNHATRDLRARMPSLASRILEIRLGTSVPAMTRRAAVATDARFRILCPGALVPAKGHDELLQALALLKGRDVRVHCVFAGSGPLRAMLQARTLELGLAGAVQFAGDVPLDVVHRWYRDGKVDAVVLPARADGEMMLEGLPVALIESMAYGIPTVASDSGGVCELLDESCGYLVHSGSPNDIAAALQRVHADPHGARARAARAYERVRTRHDVRTQMRKLASALYSHGALA